MQTNYCHNFFLLKYAERQLPLSVFTVSETDWEWLNLRLILFFRCLKKLTKKLKESVEKS